MDHIGEDVRWWVGGELDGDGSVGVYAGRLKVVLKKSVKSMTTIKRFRNLFGGSIVHSPAANEFEEAQAAWFLRAEEAQRFCKDIVPYTFLKREQFRVASEIIVGRTPIIATKDGVSKSVRNGTQLHKLIADPKILVWTVRRRIKTTAPFKLGGWSVTQIDKQLVRQKLADARKQLMAMKQQEHVNITDPPPAAYFCGFFEADGCVSITGPRSVRVGVSQKYRSICDAFASAYGGSVGSCAVKKSTLGYMWQWQASGDNARGFLRQVEPFAFEKKEQMRLALACNRENWQTNKAQMDAMKGKRKKREGLVAVSPNRQYLGTSEPTTPDVTDPL